MRDIAVLRRHPELLFPKMNALSASYDPLVLEDVIQLSKEELKDTRNDAMNEIFMDRNASRKDIVKSQRKEKRQNSVQNSNAQNFSGSTIIDLERKIAEQLKLIERLSCSLPEELAETARDQIRQMTNTGTICEWKEKMKQEHREFQQEDKKKDLRWLKLESSLCTHMQSDKNGRKFAKRNCGCFYKMFLCFFFSVNPFILGVKRQKITIIPGADPGFPVG